MNVTGSGQRSLTNISLLCDLFFGQNFDTVHILVSSVDDRQLRHPQVKRKATTCIVYRISCIGIA